MERGEQEPRSQAEEGNVGPSGSSPPEHVPQQQEQEPRQEQQNQPLTTSPAHEETSQGPPAPPKTGREAQALATRRMSRRYPFDEGGPTSASGNGSQSRDHLRNGASPSPPQRPRSGDDYRPGEGLVSPTRRHGSGLDWIIPGVEHKPYTVSHIINGSSAGQ